MSDYLPGGSFSRDLATTVLSAYFPIHLELEPIRDLEGGIVDWRIVSVVSQPANAPTGVAPETVGSRILDLVPSVRSMPVFDELREAFEANVPLVRKDLTLPTGARGKQFDLVAYRSASLMHVYGQDNSTRAASLDGFDVAFALESYFKGRMRDGSGTRIRAFYDAVDRGAGAAMVMRAPSGRSEPIEVDVLSPDVEISILSKSGRGDRAKG